MLEDVFFGHFNSRRLDLTYIFEPGLVFQCRRQVHHVVHDVGLKQCARHVTCCPLM